jgi:malate/lactate dehydrogenase
MERKDLLSANVKIFKVQGEALNNYAKKDVKVLGMSSVTLVEISSKIS